ncbi:MAG: helix-turn-helix domain-containing protein [Lachnospiraceae bacterium]|nr:helix-turn-helix domain-containing protein [Lachnospiraceae bacterium]
MHPVYFSNLNRSNHVTVAPTAAAERLHIHRTTFLYRLRKIQDIAHVDLDAWDQLLHILLSYRLLGVK